jgi:hypothetical protein
MTDTENKTTETPSVGLADIGFLLQVVEICSKRGAFNADEMTQVGTVYDKVKAFLAANAPKPDADKEEGGDQ